MNLLDLASAVILCTAIAPNFSSIHIPSLNGDRHASQNQYGVSIDNNRHNLLTAVWEHLNATVDLSYYRTWKCRDYCGFNDIESAINWSYNLADYTFLINRAVAGRNSNLVCYTTVRSITKHTKNWRIPPTIFWVYTTLFRRQKLKL